MAVPARTRNKKVEKKPPEPVFVNVSGAQDRQAGNRFLGSLKGLQIRARFFAVVEQGSTHPPPLPIPRARHLTCHRARRKPLNACQGGAMKSSLLDTTDQRILNDL